jgi:hypothetical protein
VIARRGAHTGAVDELAGPGRALADAVVAALPGWVERSVDQRYRAAFGPPPPEVVDAARRAGVAARDEVGAPLRALLEADVDEQWSTPLSIVREAVVYPTRVLAAAGVPSRERDPLDRAMFPDDTYGLTPASFADLDPQLTDVAIAWGAAKAWVHRRRHEP